jgi:hypothetical protein
MELESAKGKRPRFPQEIEAMVGPVGLRLFTSRAARGTRKRKSKTTINVMKRKSCLEVSRRWSARPSWWDGRSAGSTHDRFEKFSLFGCCVCFGQHLRKWLAHAMGCERGGVVTRGHVLVFDRLAGLPGDFRSEFGQRQARMPGQFVDRSGMPIAAKHRGGVVWTCREGKTTLTGGTVNRRRWRRPTKWLPLCFGCTNRCEGRRTAGQNRRSLSRFFRVHRRSPEGSRYWRAACCCRRSGLHRPI